MVTTQLSNDTSFSFDDSKINWGPFPYVENAEFSLCDFDEDRQIIDLMFKFEPNKKITIHTHIAQTNMLIISGELRIYQIDGAIKEVRQAGQYYRGKQDDTHSEGGGPDGAIVFYSLRANGQDELLHVIGNDRIIATISIEDVRAMWEAKLATMKI